MGAGQSRTAQTVIRQVVWLHEAAGEYYEALRWYANVSPSLSDRFARAVDNTIETIAESPLRFPIISNNRRRSGVRRFPYGLIYLVEETRIVVIACFHGKRSPHIWQNR
jgi:plasmid stabilization system protein ParE